jgi:hypothetical protein
LGSYYSFSGLIAVLFLLAGCSTASTEYKSRPFFLTEEDAMTHGRKAWYDRIVELDPGGAEFTVAADYQQAPPKKIAVLPFTDLGQGEFVVDKLPLLARSDQERARWGWSRANHLRRAFAGDVATREFTLTPLLAIDAVLAERGITDFHKLSVASPMRPLAARRRPSLWRSARLRGLLRLSLRRLARDGARQDGVNAVHFAD